MKKMMKLFAVMVCIVSMFSLTACIFSNPEIDKPFDGENIAYRSENGHLIERATETLIRGGQSSVVPNGVKAIAQAAFRRASAITELSIPFSVVSIGNYVVSDSTIATIIYHGSESAWNEVEKGRMWNSGNKDIIVEFVS